MVTDECPLATGENCAQLEGTQKRYRMVDEVDTSVHRMERPILAAPTHASSSTPVTWRCGTVIKANWREATHSTAVPPGPLECTKRKSSSSETTSAT